MNIDLKESIETLANKAKDSKTPEDAMKFSQSALNLAHVKATLVGAEKLEKQ